MFPVIEGSMLISLKYLLSIIIFKLYVLSFFHNIYQHNVIYPTSTVDQNAAKLNKSFSCLDTYTVVQNRILRKWRVRWQRKITISGWKYTEPHIDNNYILNLH